jgi:pyruvate/2-oxoacid:ferredoxin oxidoreductase alpha subunit
MKTTRRQPVRINKELWSEESRRGLEYAFAAEFYEDIPFVCYTCGAKSIFTAEQQKSMYEVRKAYVWARHVLCPTCFKGKNELSAEAASFLATWLQDKGTITTNPARISRWKEVLELLPKYGVRKDTARIRMLSKLLENAA